MASQPRKSNGGRRASELHTLSHAAMESAHRRLSDACLLVSKAAGALEVACAEYEAAQLTVKRWCVLVWTIPPQHPPFCRR